MPELTLKAIEHLLDTKLNEKLDTKLQSVKAEVAAIKTGITHLATQDSVDELTKTAAKIEKTVSSHTTSLDQLLTAKKNKVDEKTIFAARFDRLEHWAQQVGQKLDIRLEL
jgi:uncharacterized phage infection (PIP) family protein YhgE